MSTFFTSDLHLGHEAIIRATNRPFSSLDEMEGALLDNTNAVVGYNDQLFILGDLTFARKGDGPRLEGLFDRIACRHVTLVLGNHDDRRLDYPFETVTDYATVRSNRSSFKCLHYPMLTWEHRMMGTYHVHGHIHSQGPSYNERQRSEGLRRYDVGVDANDMRPVSADAIVAFFEDMPTAEDPYHPWPMNDPTCSEDRIMSGEPKTLHDSHEAVLETIRAAYKGAGDPAIREMLDTYYTKRPADHLGRPIRRGDRVALLRKNKAPWPCVVQSVYEGGPCVEGGIWVKGDDGLTGIYDGPDLIHVKD